MFKYLVFSPLLALAASLSIEDIEGDWTTVKVYPELSVRKECEIAPVKLTGERCRCGAKSEAVVISIKEEKAPIIVVLQPEHVALALNQTCYCNDQVTKHAALRPLDKDNLLVYVADKGSVVRALIVRNVPSADNLEKFEASIDEIKGHSGLVLCSEETKSAPAENTDAPHWLTYFKHHTV